MEVVQRYTRTAMVLHWLVAVLIIGNVALVWAIDYFPDDWVRPAVNTHKSLGLTVLGLAVLRLLWRAAHRPPALPPAYPKLERVGAHAAHVALYALIFALPLSGYIHDSAFRDAAAHPLTVFGIPFPRIAPIMALDPVTKEQVHSQWFAIHGALGYALYVLVSLHILGALKHQFWDREAELARIWPWGGQAGGGRAAAPGRTVP